MNLKLDFQLASNYTSNTQIARVLTEDWVKRNSFCPSCGEEKISEYPNNQPVADFFCVSCEEDFELKSKIGKLGKKITDGAYSKMIERITSPQNPNFFFLTYSKRNWLVNDFLIIPKHFFEPAMIEKRKPLKETARRAGWVGCNIDLQRIPDLGRIFMIKRSVITDRAAVIENWQKTLFLREATAEAKGWTLDVLQCLDKIVAADFSLDDVYNFAEELKQKYPNNNFIKDKIRQQLQVLRDMNIIAFVARGKYRKVA
jgi:type II restriction enzyme